jgi:hypothetical protein
VRGKKEHEFVLLLAYEEFPCWAMAAGTLVVLSFVDSVHGELDADWGSEQVNSSILSGVLASQRVLVTRECDTSA